MTDLKKKKKSANQNLPDFKELEHLELQMSKLKRVLVINRTLSCVVVVDRDHNS